MSPGPTDEEIAKLDRIIDGDRFSLSRPISIAFGTAQNSHPYARAMRARRGRLHGEGALAVDKRDWMDYVS